MTPEVLVDLYTMDLRLMARGAQVHQKPCSVLEEMRQAEIHPALVRLSERLLNSAFELQALGARPPKAAWQQLLARQLQKS